MLKTKVNGGVEHEIEFKNDLKSGTINGEDFALDLLELKAGSYHLIQNNKSYNIEVLDANPDEKQYTLSINGKKHVVDVQDRYDELLKNLGMDSLANQAIKELKAPMPGLVLEIIAGPGTEVKKGDPLLVLEAMKMENVLKAPADAVVKNIAVEKSAAVEKNQVLVNFE